MQCIRHTQSSLLDQRFLFVLWLSCSVEPPLDSGLTCWQLKQLLLVSHCSCHDNMTSFLLQKVVYRRLILVGRNGRILPNQCQAATSKVSPLARTTLRHRDCARATNIHLLQVPVTYRLTGLLSFVLLPACFCESKRTGSSGPNVNVIATSNGAS